MTSDRRDLRQVRGAALVGLAMTFGNVCAYAFVVLAAQILEPARYGEVGAVMGLLLVLGVVSLGLQASAARLVASRNESIGGLERHTMRQAFRAAGALLIIGVVASPVVSRALELSTPLTAIFAAWTAAELAVMGAAAGLLQGERAWHQFALVQCVYGLGRLVVAALILLVWPTAAGAILGVAVGAALPMLTAVWIVRRRRQLDPSRSPSTAVDSPVASATPAATATLRPEGRIGLLSVVRDSHLLLALLVLSNIDVLLARSTLTDHESGLYAAGLIVTKAVLFLPQFVITVAFPDMVERDGKKALRVTAVVVLALGSLAIASVVLLSPIALTFVGGSDYADVQHELWLFAALGTLLALVNVLVFRFLATARGRMEWLVWAAVAAVVVAAPSADSVTQLAVRVMAIDLMLLSALAWIEHRDQREHSTPELATKV